MIERPRLLPAVILGALSLFALKALGWMHDAGAFRTAEATISEVAPKPELKGFAKIMGKAREPYLVQDPETTGSVKKEEKKPDPKKEAEEKEAEARKAADPRNKAAVVNSGQRAMTPSEKAIYEKLGERRDEIEGRARELEMREKLLETVEKKIEGKAGELKQIEEKLTETKEQGGANPAAGLKNLVVMYETMKPKDAARIFDRLSIDVLLPVVQSMNPRKMSDVLAAMSPEAAEKLTVAIATRSGGPVNPAQPAAPPPSLPGGELPALTPARQPPAQRN